jgi:hypothetical protein
MPGFRVGEARLSAIRDRAFLFPTRRYLIMPLFDMRPATFPAPSSPGSAPAGPGFLYMGI